MSKDNREEIQSKIEYLENHTSPGTTIAEYLGEIREYIDVLESGTGKVTIDSGADVCEWWETATKGLYDNGCGLPGFSLTNNPLCSFKYCPYCGKPIAIKGK